MSDYFAFSSIDTALDRTKSLLWPFQKGIWLRIAFISLFIGGFSSFNPFQFTSDTEDFPFITSGSDAFIDQLPIILAVIGIILVIALIFSYISCVFQYLFVECLSKNEFSIRKYFKTNTGRGLRLFGFELLIAIAMIAVIAAAALFLFMGVSDPSSFPGFGYLIMLFLVILLISIPFGIITLFTIDFVVPIMIKDNCNLTDGWRRCFALMKKDWVQTIIYFIMRIILAIVTAILMFIAIMIAALILAIPFFIVGVFGLLALGGGFPLAAVIIILAVLFIICLIPVALLISVPFVAFLKYYILEVLGCMDENYVLLE